MEIKFSTEELEEVKKHISKYPEKQAALMPVLWMAQHKWGWLSDDVMKYIGELLELPVSHIEGVATFYTMYFKKPMGKYHVQVCTNVSCMLRKGDILYKQVSEKLNLKHNEATNDGIFSLEEVECMGACGGAPMIAINEDFYENTNFEHISQIIDSLK